MTRRTIITLFFAVVVSAINSFASPPSAQTIDSLRSDLSQAKTAVDSLHILYDIYDLSPVSDYRVVLEELRDAALSAGDTNALLDIIRRSASSNASDNNSCPYWDNMLHSLPPSRERDETALFMAIQRAVYTARAQSQDERLATIAQFIAEFDREDDESADDDKAAAILRLYTLIIYLSTETNGSMQSDYIDQLGKLIADIDLYALKNQYYTRVANYYTTLGLAKKAIEANSKLLSCIDDLEKEKRESGRHYRSYDRNRYSCYRRMLYNASALSREEIEESYANLGRIASKSESLTRYYEADDTAHAFYYMAVDQPLKALPHLQNLLKDENNLPVHKKTRILWMLRKAYAQIGDKAGELQALSDYNDLLAAYNEIDASQKYRELQIKYDVHKLKAEKATLELEKRDSNLRTTRRSLFMTGGMLIAVAILLFILFYYFRRSRNLYTKLSKTVDILEKERDELQRVQKEFIAARDRAEIANRAKDDFLHNMSHELRTPLNAIIGFSNVIVHKMPADMKASMDRYSSHIDKNARQLENLINDVLFLSSINPNLTDISSETISIGQIFDNVIDNICNSPHPGVTVNVDETMSRRHITTDRNKVELILGKLLANALKFTDKGHIDMAAMINADNDTVIFTVTDSGCGIPPEKKDEIFDRFTKLNSFVPGAGLGLYISRQVANMLGGTIELDTTYIYGAKFVLTIPRNISGSQTYTERFAFSASR